MAERDWRQTFEETFEPPPSKIQERVWRDVFRDEYPEGVDPYSYITSSELERLAVELRVGVGDAFVDVGCGRGGAGVWVARRTGARLVGLDIARSALAAARTRAAEAGLDDAEFRLGSFEETGLGDASLDGAMSVDALIFTPDKETALRELARILRPGARLVLTTWDYSRQPPDRPPQVDDHRPLLKPAGFALVGYEVTDRWRERLDATNAGLLAAAAELAAEAGEPVDEVRADLEQMVARADALSRRVLLVAERR